MINLGTVDVVDEDIHWNVDKRRCSYISEDGNFLYDVDFDIVMVFSIYYMRYNTYVITNYDSIYTIGI